jgi:hypothetical protein
MRVRAFGYARSDELAGRLIELSEVTLVTSPESLRRISNHLLEAAAQMERDPTFGHRHLRDTWSGWSEADADVIVAQQ